MSVSTFLQDRIKITEDMIVLYEEAITFLISNPTQSYKLDTGETEQEVTRHNVNNLQDKLDSLYNRLTVLNKRFCSRPTINAPGW
jgi:hypothetical protein